MEGIYVGSVTKGFIDKNIAILTFKDHHQDIGHLDCVIEDDDTTYCLVPSDDIIFNNTELLELRKKVAELEKDRDYWKDRFGSVVTDVSKVLESNGVELTLKTIDGNKWNVGIDIPELNEARAKVADLEKKLKVAEEKETYWRDRKEEEEDHHHYWLHTFDRAVKQAAEKRIHIGVRGNDEECNSGIVVVDNMKAEDLEKQVVALEKTNKILDQKIGACDNALEYWNNTYNDIVIAAKKAGVKIDIKGKKPDMNAGFVYVTNEKAEDLEKQVVQMEDANQKLRQRISSADEEIEKLKKRDISKVALYWRDTYYTAVEKAKAEGVIIVMQGMDLDRNVAHIKVVNHRTANLERQIKRLEDDNSAKAEAVVAAKNRGDVWMREFNELTLNYHILEKKHDEKWSAMMKALKDKGVEVLYMGEQDDKPIIDIKVPAIDILRKDYIVRGQAIDDLKKELEALKSRTLDNVEIRLNCGDIIWTYCDGFTKLSSMFDATIPADQISTGTVPKCSSCAYYVSGSRWAHIWCHKPVSKEGPGTIRRLSTEEAEGPACVDFKARKE